MRRGLQRLAAVTAQPPPSAAIPAPIEAFELPQERRLLPVVSAALVMVCVTFAALYFATRSSLDDANERARQLTNDLTALSDARFLPVAAVPRVALDGLLAMLEWAANRDNRYAFDGVPLDDDRAALLMSLFEQIERLGFAGTVAIDVHVGRFCMNFGSDGALELAPPDQPAATCEQVGWSESEAITLGQRQSLAFANAVASTTARNPRLRVESVSLGSSMPLVDYPVVGYELRAGAWNAAAAANHRVEVRLLPADAESGIPANPSSPVAR
jgi:hypothetical protein